MYKRIVVGTDGSVGANVAVDAAIELARQSGATLHVVYAHKPVSASSMAAATQAGVAPNMVEANEGMKEEGDRICAEVVERAEGAGVHTESHCVGGDPADALVRVTEDADADLLVVGNRGMSGPRRFVLGSVPNKVSHHCPTNLLVVDTSRARH